MTQSEFTRKNQFLPQFWSLPQINCKIQKEWLKRFGPLKTNCTHTHTHTHTFPVKFNYFTKFWTIFGKKWLGKCMLSVV